MLTFEDVVRMTSHLPGIDVGTSYGTALRVGKNYMCRTWEDDETLVLKLVEDLEIQFLMDTDEGWPTVLIDLSRR